MIEGALHGHFFGDTVLALLDRILYYTPPNLEALDRCAPSRAIVLEEQIRLDPAPLTSLHIPHQKKYSFGVGMQARVQRKEMLHEPPPLFVVSELEVSPREMKVNQILRRANSCRSNDGRKGLEMVFCEN